MDLSAVFLYESSGCATPSNLAMTLDQISSPNSLLAALQSDVLPSPTTAVNYRSSTASDLYPLLGTGGTIRRHQAMTLNNLISADAASFASFRQQREIERHTESLYNAILQRKLKDVQRAHDLHQFMSPQLLQRQETVVGPVQGLYKPSYMPASTSQSFVSLSKLLASQNRIKYGGEIFQDANVCSLSSSEPSSNAKHLNANMSLQALGSTMIKSNSPYIDASTLPDPDAVDLARRRTRGGVAEPFPEKLHRMLDELARDGNEDVASFFSHGRAFGVHNPDRFVEDIMPKYFKQSRLSSFYRQLNLYGFVRIASGPDVGGYYHPLFLRGRPAISIHMRRVGIPHGKDRRKHKESPFSKVDPDFYAMVPISASMPLTATRT